MSKHHTPAHYSKPVIALHWLSLLLIAAVYALMEFHEVFPKGSAERLAMKSWHFTLGMTVFVLAWLRILMRAVSNTPPITPAPPAWQAMAAKLLHLALYAMLIMLPISGWLMVSADGGHVWFWGANLPALVGPNESLADNIKEIHETVASIGYFLIGLHAAAGLAHHYLLKDDTLRRMLPKRR